MKVAKIFYFILLPLQILFGQNDSLLINLPIKVWYEHPNSKIRPLCPTEPPGIFQGTCDCACVIDDWCGGAYDPNHDKLIVWGGGHDDYYGNELYAFDLPTLSWELLTQPSVPASPRNCVEVLSDGRPNARHTYGGLAYLTHVDLFFAHGGSLACGSGTGSKKTWTFDLNTTTWSDMNPTGTRPDWDTLDEYCVYDPVSQLVFLFWHSELFRYDYGQNRWAKLDDHQISYPALGCTIDSKRGLLVEVGRGFVAVHDIRNQNYTRQTWNTTGGNAIVNAYAPGLAYDPIADRVIGWNGGTVYSLNMDTKTWDIIDAPGAPPGTSSGIFGRFRYLPKYNIFIAVTSVDRNVSFYKNTPGLNGANGYEQRGAGNALNFDGWDGTNGEYVNIGNIPQLAIKNDLTIEAWVNIASLPTENTLYSIVTYGNHRGDTGDPENEGDNQLYELAITPLGKVQFTHEYGNGQEETHVSNTEMILNKWMHLAFVRNTTNSTLLFIINGMEENNQLYSNAPTGGESSMCVLGGGFGDTGTPNIPIDVGYFKGVMDEVRIWNTALSRETIRNYMNRKVTADHPSYENLQGYWRLDESSPSAVIIDQTGNNNGILQYTEDGDKITSTAPIGDASIFAVESETSAEITGTAEVPIDVAFEDDLYGPALNSPLAAIQINTSPNNTTGLLAHSPNTYWELWARDVTFDNLFTATVSFHYDHLDGMGVENESRLYRRDDATEDWLPQIANIETGNSNSDGIGHFEITITEETNGGFSGQYIITSDHMDNPLPVEIATFTANLVDDGVQLEWVTSSEVNNQGFEIWRATDNNENFEMISSYINNERLIGAGNSNITHYYEYLDKNVLARHKYYYKLWDVSYSGEYNCHEAISISVGNVDNITENYILHQNYPNPFNSTTEICFTLPEAGQVSLKILNVLGEVIWIMSDSYYETGHHSKQWHGVDKHGIPVPSGVYIYRLSVGSLTTKSSNSKAGKAGNYVKSRKMVLMR